MGRRRVLEKLEKVVVAGRKVRARSITWAACGAGWNVVVMVVYVSSAVWAFVLFFGEARRFRNSFLG